jgi:hypothetical protein
VAGFITGHFIPVRFHVKRNPEGFARFKAQWTPTQIILDAQGEERYRIEGFLPKDDYLAQLTMGLGRLDFERGDFTAAAREFDDVLVRHPGATSAPEARYWAGVSRYKGSNDAGALKQTAQDIAARWPESEWAKKASIWTT